MKIDLVLTAGNINHHYLQLYPLVYTVWKKRFNLDCYLVLISKDIPDYLQDYKDYIILFDPIENINDVYIAQVIRLLYPAIFKEKTVLISDLDIIPVKKNYFIEPIKYLHNDTFVSYTNRYYKQNMYAICYNVGKGNTFGKMFNINSIEDIKERLKEWYNINYTGKKNCDGWYTDQLKLFEHFEKYDGYKKVLDDKSIGYKRLNNRARDKEYIIKNFNEILENIESYSDIHCIKPYSKTKNYLKKMVNKIIS